MWDALRWSVVHTLMKHSVYGVISAFVDHSPLPRSLVASAGREDQISSAGPEDLTNSVALPHAVRLRHFPQSARVPAFQPEKLWQQFR